jgi:hypothetical protein
VLKSVIFKNKKFSRIVLPQFEKCWSVNTFLKFEKTSAHTDVLR